MKIKKLRRFNLWKLMTGLLVVSVIGLVVTLKVTQAKYRYTSKMNIVNGTVHYESRDISVLAINLEQEDGSYISSNTFPTSGYVINEENSTCFISQNGTKVSQDVTLSYTDNTLTITGLKVNDTKCKLYFDIDPCNGGVACQSILANNTIDTSRSSGSFTAIFTDDTAGTIFTGTDDYGTTYFFAGANPNNWVKFAGFYWRIIRINGDGSIRLIYYGTDSTSTGTTTQISTSKFYSSYNDNAYVGYMYGTTGASTYSATHTNTNSSTIKGVLDTWYSSNLSSYASYIDTNAGFCGDRTLDPTTSGTGAGKSSTDYVGNYRFYDKAEAASYKCGQTNDLYTVSSSSYGNKKLTYPIGLITADEVAYAGGYYNTSNSSYWLYTNQTYWTMSPSFFDGSCAFVFRVDSYGRLYSNIDVANYYGARPVVNLKSSTTFAGSGTSSDPYIVS